MLRLPVLRVPLLRLAPDDRLGPVLRLPLEDRLGRAPLLRLPLDDRFDGGETRDGEELRDGALPERMRGAWDGADLVLLELGDEDRADGEEERGEDWPDRTAFDRVLVVVLLPVEDRVLGTVDREPTFDRVLVEERVPVVEREGALDREPTDDRVEERVEGRLPTVERVEVVPLVEVTPREVEPKADRVVRVPGSDLVMLLPVLLASAFFVAVDAPPRTTFLVPSSDLGLEVSVERPPRVTPVVPRVRRPPDASEVRPIVRPRGAQWLPLLPTTETPPDHHGL